MGVIVKIKATKIMIIKDHLSTKTEALENVPLYNYMSNYMCIIISSFLLTMSFFVQHDIVFPCSHKLYST